MIMFYSLFQLANTSSKNDTFGSVCQAVTANLRKFKNYSIQEMADICSVSNSTISRLASHMDYRNFTTMVAQLYDLKDDYVAGGSLLSKLVPLQKAPAEAFQEMRSCINDVETVFSYEKVRHCVELLQDAEKVIIAGFPHPQGIEALQMELAIQNIASTAFVNPDDQYEELTNAGEHDVVILFDCYLHKTIFTALAEHYSEKGKLILVTCSETRRRTVRADEFICFEDRNFSMNMFSASVIIYTLVSALQASDVAPMVTTKG